MKFEPIGVIRSDFDEPADPHEMRQHESRIVLEDAYEEGLYRIERNDYLKTIFYIHESGEVRLSGERLYGEKRGTFACRSPNRPNPIGVTTVELLERNGRTLRVDGLDAIDGTPLLDLKPHAPSLDCPDREATADRRQHPRAHVQSAVRNRDLDAVVLDAAALHGHACPRLAIGGMAGVYAQRELGVASRGGDETVAVVESNDCFADGVQYATGCTFGNNRLVYREFGKTAMTLVAKDRPENGVRIRLRSAEEDGPTTSEIGDLFEVGTGSTVGMDCPPDDAEVGFDLLGRPLREMCDIEIGVSVDLPAVDAGDDFVSCGECNEPVRASKVVDRNDELLCIPCAGTGYAQLDGAGLRRVGLDETSQPPD